MPAETIAVPKFCAQASAGCPRTFTPNMIGDLLGGGGYVFITSEAVARPGGGLLSRFQISQNHSPLPQDRVYFNYSHSSNAQTSRDATVDVDRFTFGLEKTIGASSLSLVVPFASGLDSKIQRISRTPPTDVQFGDMALAIKHLLLERSDGAISAGLAVTLPTGPDASVGSGRRVRIENEAVHLQPFIGSLWNPKDVWFCQSFLSFDFDANGNSTVLSDHGGTISGVYRDQHLFNIDATVGRWFCRNDCRRYMLGLAGLVELHYTTTISDSDIIGPNSLFGVSNPFNRMDILNLTAGLHCQLTARSDFRVAASVPLLESDLPGTLVDDQLANRPFDAQVVLQFNRYF